MALPERRQINSNDTGLFAAKEASPGVMPGTEQWFQVLVRDYPEFGGKVTTVADEIISTSRQVELGSAVDLAASGGVAQNMSQETLREFWPSVFASTSDEQPQHGGVFETSPTVTATGYDIGSDAATAGYEAGHLVWGESFTNAANNGLKVVTAVAGDEVQFAGSVVEASPPTSAKITAVGLQGASGDLTINVAGTLPALTSTVLDFTDFDIQVGDLLWIGGRRVTDANNAFAFDSDEDIGLVRVASVAANSIEIDWAPTRDAVGNFTAMVVDSGASKTIRVAFGDRTYNKRSDAAGFLQQNWRFERRLGVPNPVAAPTIIQAESLVGGVLNDTSIRIQRAALIGVDMRFLALDKVDHDGTGGDPRDTDGETILSLPPGVPFNSTANVLVNDFVVVPPDTAPSATPEALVGFITSGQFNISNSAQILGAVSVFGGFEISLGNWRLGATMDAYFTNIAGPQTVRNSSTVAIMFGVQAISNGRRQGTVIHSPYGLAGDGALRVAPNTPISMPLTFDAARQPTLDYSMKVTQFNWLP